MVLQVFSSNVFKFLIFFLGHLKPGCFNICVILSNAENIVLFKEFSSIADKLAAAMVTLELLIVSEMGV